MYRTNIIFAFFIPLLISSCNQTESNKNIIENNVDSNIKNSATINIIDTFHKTKEIIIQKRKIKQSQIYIDTSLIASFLDQMIKIRYSGKGLVCSKSLKIPLEMFDCSPPIIINGKPTIPDFYHSLICHFFNYNEIQYFKKQSQLQKRYSINSFKSLEKYNIIDCDTITTEKVINEFSIPLFTKDKKTALIIYTDKISKRAICTKRIDIYKIDSLNKWGLYKNILTEDYD